MSAPDMALPAGQACAQCRHFAKCSWLVSRKGTETHCDWSPSKFVAAPAPTPAQPPPAEGT